MSCEIVDAPRVIRSGGWGRAASAVALVAVTGLASLMLARMPTRAGVDLLPRVDALEYAVVAARLADGAPPTIPIGPSAYPSRYPIGFPLLLAPAVRVGVPPERLYRVTQICALLGVVALFVVCRRLAGAAVATWAAAMLALSPRYLELGTLVMSDVPSAVAAIVWAALVLRGGPAVALGIVAGFACSVRLMNVPLVLGGAVACMSTARRSIAFALGLAIGIAPMVVHAWGGWSSGPSGYAFWMPERYDPPSRAFGLASVSNNLSSYVPVMLGLERHPQFFAAPVTILAALAWRRATAPLAIVGGTAAAYVALALPYFFADARLLLPVLPLALIVAAVGLGVLRRTSEWGAVAIAVVTLVAQTIAADRVARAELGEPDHALLAIVAAQLPADALIVSDVPAALAWLHWVRGSARTFLPLAVPPLHRKRTLDDRHVRRLFMNAQRPTWRGAGAVVFGDPRGGALVGQARLAGRPVVFVACNGYGRRVLESETMTATLAVRPTIGRCEVRFLEGPDGARYYAPPVLSATPGACRTSRSSAPSTWDASTTSRRSSAPTISCCTTRAT